jgi:hypothetical protein
VLTGTEELAGIEELAGTDVVTEIEIEAGIEPAAALLCTEETGGRVTRQAGRVTPVAVFPTKIARCVPAGIALSGHENTLCVQELEAAMKSTWVQESRPDTSHAAIHPSSVDVSRLAFKEGLPFETRYTSPLGVVV